MLKEQSPECSARSRSDPSSPLSPRHQDKLLAVSQPQDWSSVPREGGFEEGLKAKLERLKAWVAALGPLRESGINPESLQQMQIEEEVYRNVGSETVVAQAERRIEKMAKTRKLKRNWSVCDLKILIWLICKHCEQTGLPVGDLHNHPASWRLISSLIPGTSPESCLFKWLSLRRHKITLHGWSEQEEQILLRLEKKHADSRNKWKFISEELYALNAAPDKIYRHPKQCREHYASFLDPAIKKGPWTKDEDLTLLAHIIDHAGEKKWCRLVKILEGRTENAIKNRFQLLFAKLRKRKENKSKPELELITDYVNENGGMLKKQRDPAVNNRKEDTEQEEKEKEEALQGSPLSHRSHHSRSPSVDLPPVAPKLPVIPTFNFFPSSRSLSAFVPYLQQPLYQQLPDSVYRQLTRRSVGSLQTLPVDRQP